MRDVLDVVESPSFEQPGLAQQLHHMLVAGFGQSDRALLFVEFVIVLAELRDQRVDGA